MFNPFAETIDADPPDEELVQQALADRQHAEVFGDHGEESVRFPGERRELASLGRPQRPGRPAGSGGWWLMDTPRGPGRLRIRPDERTGILDQELIDAQEGRWIVPTRVVASKAAFSRRIRP